MIKESALGEDNMREQVEKLRKLLMENDIDVFLGSNPLTRKYLAGFTGYGGYVIIGHDRMDIATDFCHYEQAEQESPDFRLVKLTYSYTILDYIKENGFKKVAFEESTMTAAEYLNLKAKLPEVEFVYGAGLLAKVKQIKTPEEIAGHKKSCEVTNAIVKDFFEYAKVGMTEKQLFEFVLERSKFYGAEAQNFQPIVLIGENASLPHGNPTDRVLKDGDFLLLDMGVIYKGYASDVTRTAVMGKASDKQKEIYEIVRYAQKESIKQIKVGMSSYEAHMISQRIIDEAGYGKCYGHAVGHGFKDGIIVRNTEADKDFILQENMVFTVEPGIYIPGFGGVRIEDDVVLTKDGCVSFCTYTTDLQELHF